MYGNHAVLTGKRKSLLMRKGIIIWNIRRWISGMLTIGLLLLTIYVLVISYCERKDGKPFFLLGYKPVLILSQSMEPTIPAGAIILIREKREEPVENQIVLFRQKRFHTNVFVTHRIIGKEAEGYRTKGENNPTEDPGWVQEKEIYGVFAGILIP
jgi:signal peptidase